MKKTEKNEKIDEEVKTNKKEEEEKVKKIIEKAKEKRKNHIWRTCF